MITAMIGVDIVSRSQPAGLLRVAATNRHYGMAVYQLVFESISSTGIGGSVVESSPATRGARVRFPANAFFISPF